MKILLMTVLLFGLLSGCKAEMTMETVADTLDEPVLAQPREIAVSLPGEAAVPAMENGSDRYYLCDDYEIALETREGGDISATVADISGHDPEDLTVVKTRQAGADRYDFVWAAAGETGQQLGRAAILDDGTYHYTMTVLRDAENTETLQVVWRQVFSSFGLS